MATALAPALLGSTTPRLWTGALAAGPAGPCGCGCALTPQTSLGFSAVDFYQDVLGIRLIPWQRWLLIHALELRWDGRFRFRVVLVLVARQNGKALDEVTPILTANRGWITMADVAVGDEVFHPSGATTRVTFVSETQVGRDCYTVTTTDGREVVADADHLWTVIDKRRARSEGARGAIRRKWFETRTLTTREMLAEGLSRRASGGRTSMTDGKRYATNEYRFQLPRQEPLKSDDVSLPLDPYLLGAWLGDGTTAAACLTSHVDDVPHWEAMVRSAGFIPTVRASGGTPQTRTVGITCTPGIGRHSRSFASHLVRLGVLGHKHIPDLYLSAGTAQREALLQGLLDTDGSIEARRGQVEFCSTTRELADGVLLLARSLGWRATLREGRAVCAGRDYGPKYRVFFTPTRTDQFAPFRLERKAVRVRAADGGKGRTTLSVARIEQVPSVPVRCIKVEAPDGLFLAGRGLMPTHNTTLVGGKNLWKMSVLQVPLVIGTAQNLDISEEAWDAAVELAESTPELAAEIRHVDRTNGKKALRLSNGSRWKIAAASRKGGRGLSGDDVNLDELREHQNWLAWGAVSKTTMARPNAQIWAYSNAGDSQSVVLNDLQAKGRAAAEDPALDPSFGYFEWSAPDDVECTCGRLADKHARDCRLRDVTAWAQANPSLGYTITVEALESALSTDPEPIFRTECLCQRVPDMVPQWSVIPQSAWLPLVDPHSRPTGKVAFSLDANPERTHGAIGVSGRRPDDMLHVGLTVKADGTVDHRPGLDWMVDRAVELNDRWEPLGWAIAPGSPALSLRDELASRGIEVTVPSAAEYAQACGQIYDDVVPPPDAEGWMPRLRHLGQAEIDAALAGAAKSDVGDGAWKWSRKGASVDISPIVAPTLARWLFVTKSHVKPVEPFAFWD